MSRLPPRGNLKSRESVFNSGPDLYRGEIQAQCPPDLEGCVMALEDCCEEAYEAQMLLRNGTRDYPRIAKVLHSQRFFLLVNEFTIAKAKADLAVEIEPAIKKLIENAEDGVRMLEKQESLLQKTLNSRRAPGTTASDQVEMRRAQQLKRQRERLEKEMKELQAEVEDLELSMVQ